MRRNLPLIYIIEDNGVYGLTKGQFSATADLGSKLKTGVVNDLPPIDTCALAIELGRDVRGALVLRRQEAAAGACSRPPSPTAARSMLDVISPCVTFNDHEGSTKSYTYVKDHDEPLQEISFVPSFEDIDVDYDPGTTLEVTMHDGSQLRLRKLDDDYDPTNKLLAIKTLTEAHHEGETLTGVFYIDPNKPTFMDLLHVTDEPLATLPAEAVRPPKAVLDEVMESLR